MLPPPREFTNSVELTPYGESRTLTTIVEPLDDVWSSLLALALEKQFLKIAVDLHGRTRAHAKSVFPRARFYLLQAHEFSRAAQLASRRAAPLLDYYSMLNLAKFALAVIRPDLVTSPTMRHGLGIDRSNYAKPRRVVLKPAPGVFSALTEMLTGESVGDSFTLDDAMARLVDISHEYQNAWNARNKFVLCHAFRRSSETTAESWLYIELFAVSTQAARFVRKMSWPGCAVASFVRVDSGNPVRAALESAAINWTKGVELADQDVLSLLRRLRPHLGPLEQQVVPGTERRTQFLPYAVGGKAPLPELSAILAVAFYLSDVVRYEPYYFEESPSEDDSWVFSTFARTCPRKFTLLTHSLLRSYDFRLRRH